MCRKNSRGRLHQAVFVMHVGHGRLPNAISGRQLVPMVVEWNAVLGSGVGEFTTINPATNVFDSFSVSLAVSPPA